MRQNRIFGRCTPTPAIKKTLAGIMLAALAQTPAMVSAQGAEPPTPKIVDSEHFSVQIIDTYDDVWDDAGSGAKLSVTIVRPRSVEPGYFFFGDVAIPMEKKKAMKDPPHSFALKPKTPQDERRFAEPESLRWLYSDKGSSNDRNVAIFIANCPRGYVALGAVAMDSDAIGTGEEVMITNDAAFDRIRSYRCVSDRDVIRATWQREPLWTPLDNDGEKRGEYNVGIWQADYTGGLPPEGHLVVSPRAIYAVRSSSEAPLASEAWALKISIKDMPNLTEPVGISGQELKKLIPRLEGPFPSSSPSAMTKAGDYDVPFFMINDPKYNQLEQWLITPNYKVTRSVSYKYYRDYDNTNCAVPSISDGKFTYVTGTDNTKEHTTGFDRTWGNSITLGYSRSAEAEGGVPGVAGGKVTTEFSANWTNSFDFSWSSSHMKSDTASEETTWEQVVPRGTYAALYLKTSTYEVRRDGVEDKGAIDSSNMVFDHDQPVFLTWAPEGWSAKNPCGAQLGAEANAAALRGEDVVVSGQTQAPASSASAAAPVPIELPTQSGLLSCSIGGKPCTDSTSSGFYLTQDDAKGQASIVEFADDDTKPVVTVEKVILDDGREAVQFYNQKGHYLRVDEKKNFHASFDGEKADHATYFVTRLPLDGAAVDHASFESAHYPKRILRHRGMMLFADAVDMSSELFRRDGTWRVVNLGQ